MFRARLCMNPSQPYGRKGSAYGRPILAPADGGMVRNAIPSPMSVMCSHLALAEHPRCPLRAPCIGRGAL
jgi:hypothetical protein